MKNNTIKYAGFIVVIIMLVVIIGVMRSNNTSEPQMSPTGTVTPAQTTAKPNSYTSGSRTSTYTAPAKTTSSTSYVTYLTQLRAAQNSCSNAANAQFNALYGSLQSSAATSYYDIADGLCYGEFTGKIQEAYSTTTTGYVYFRNVSHNILLAECIDPTGTLYADSNWNCTDKTTGQTISKPQFNAMVGAVTTAQ